MDNNLIKRFTLSYVLLICIIFPKSLSHAGNIIYLTLNCYGNPGHLNFDGAWCDFFPNGDCDPQFEICLGDSSSQPCRLFSHTTGYFNNRAWVCGDTRGILSSPIKITLNDFLSPSFYLRVFVRDHDSSPSIRSTQIAIFGTEFSITPTTFSQPLLFHSLNLVRLESSYKNPGARLSMEAAVQCQNHQYGSRCEITCEPNFEHYSCDNQGNKICRDGWIGNNCDTKDFCKLLGCAKGASCTNNPSSRTCTCSSGSTGPHCYPNYNHCSSSPCRNGGTCSFSSSNDTYSCSCSALFTGLQCETIIDFCAPNPCFNSGKCFSSRYGDIICACNDSFSGPRCEISSVVDYLNDSNDKNVNFGNTTISTSSLKLEEDSEKGWIAVTATVVVLILIALIAGCVVAYCFVTLRRKRLEKTEEMTVHFEAGPDNHPTIADNQLYEDIDAYEIPDPPYTPMGCHLKGGVHFAEQSEYVYPDDSGHNSMVFEPFNIYVSDPSLATAGNGCQPIGPAFRSDCADMRENRPPLPERNQPKRQTSGPRKFVRATSNKSSN